MRDILPDIAELLSEVADVELSFSDHFNSLPCIVLSEIGNASSVILSGKDRFSVITLQVDVYDRDEKSVRSIALAANDILAAKGIKRSFSQFFTDEKLPRMCMRYRFGIDEVSGRTVSI